MTGPAPGKDARITPTQPNADANVQAWVRWYWTQFLPAWVARAADASGIGFVDQLDALGHPTRSDRRTVLAQARLLFSFAHLALLSENPAFKRAACIARDALPAFRKAPGGYCRARGKTGGATENPEDALAASYDQSFVILGLSTWGRLHPSEDVSAELELCWSFIEEQLTDPLTGLLLEHDGLDDPAAEGAPYRAQNPHMHLYEAALQAFEMTGRDIWLARAGKMRAKGLDYFFDRESGTILEFLAPDLAHLAGRAGLRREIGHQCEWAWLLMREVELGGDPGVRETADQLLAFADRHGFQSDGAMRGAAFDAVSADATWREERFLLWPQTEAIKSCALRAQSPVFSQQAQSLALLMFQRYFRDRAAFANQLDENAVPIWADALSRLHYHIVLALTEGARAGLWSDPI